MKTWISCLALIFSLSAFGACNTPDVSTEGIPSPYLKVVAEQMTGFDGDKGDKMTTAMRVLEDVVNSQEFKNAVINFKNDKCQRAFASNKGLTNEQIYAIFMEGNETLQPGTSGEMNFYVNLYNAWWSKVIGYTTGKTNVININWKYFKGNSVNNVAANLAHEWTHKIGFDHKSAKEHDSAPYAIGYIVGELVKARLSTGLY